MSTKVFLSWSGELSRKAAEIFKDWLEIVIQDLEVFYSEDDITKGTHGIDTIFSKLRESVASVIMLTKENQTSPWICFEAGAIVSKDRNALACGLMLNLSISELKGPLQHLQQTTFERKDVFKLLKSINTKCQTPLSQERLQRAFENNWDSLNNKMINLINEHSSESSNATGKNSLKKEQQKAKESSNTNSYISQVIDDNYDDINILLETATNYNNRGIKLTLREIIKSSKLSKSQAELIIDLCLKMNLISKDINPACFTTSDPYIYKITPMGTLTLNRIKRYKTKS